MEIERQVDVEDEVYLALKDHVRTYTRPLPKYFSLPCILITLVGGTQVDKIDSFDLVLDARAETEAEANEYLRNAIGILQKQTLDQVTAIRHMELNSTGSWGTDPVRPNIAMCSARIRVYAHPEQTEV